MEDLLPFNDPDYIASPYAYWERLRDEAPGGLLPSVQLQPEAGARIPFGILRGWLHLPLTARNRR